VSRRSTAIAATVLTLAAAAIYTLRVDDVAGLIVDDAWYMVLGKALADGEGFRLISSSASAIVPSVPPGFPALLAVVFKLNPAYPANLWLLKAVSILAMAGVGVACWIYYTRYRQVPASHALWMVFAVVLTPAFVFVATSTVMAECVFTLAQLAAVIGAERVIRRDAADVRAPMLAGVLAALALLVRTAGLAVVGATLVYFLLERRFRQAAVFAVVVAAAMLPWQLYAFRNAPTDEERMAHGGTIAYRYTQLLGMESPGAATTQVSPGRMTGRALRNVADIVARDIGAVFLPVLYRGPEESGGELISVGRPGRGSMGVATGTMVVSTLLSLLIVVGVVRARAWFSLPAMLIVASMVMIAPVGALTYRYVVPLAPFLLLFLWRGIAHPAVARVAVLCVLGFHLFDHGMYLRVQATAAPVWIGDAREIDEVLSWIEASLPDDGSVASSNPGLVYLRTGRKGIVSAYPDKNWESWRASGVRYVAALRRSELPSRWWKAQVLFQTKRRLWVVRM
jgi:Glycosyltransferase family 87